MENRVEEARNKWIEASDKASKLANELFQSGSGYGNPQERENDEHQLRSAREETERLFREYHDLDKQDMDQKILSLQRSQYLATWASFAVAAVVGIATVVGTAVSLLG